MHRKPTGRFRLAHPWRRERFRRGVCQSEPARPLSVSTPSTRRLFCRPPVSLTPRTLQPPSVPEEASTAQRDERATVNPSQMFVYFEDPRYLPIGGYGALPRTHCMDGPVFCISESILSFRNQVTRRLPNARGNAFYTCFKALIAPRVLWRLSASSGQEHRQTHLLPRFFLPNFSPRPGLRLSPSWLPGKRLEQYSQFVLLDVPASVPGCHLRMTANNR